MNKWMGMWTFVWLVSWCVSGQATPVKPYQLCHWPWSPSGWPPRVAGTSQLSIETNYRYPSSASHRQVEGANSGACDLPVHEVLSGARGQATDIEIEARETLRLNDLLRNILAKNTGQDGERIRRDFDRNFYMDAQAAKEYGMIDEILSRAN